MNKKEKSVPREYNVVLLDSSTSPKVNKYIRDLTGKTIWDVSTLMSSTPSNILERVSLNQALDVKSQLAKYGLKAEIKSVEALAKDTSISGAALVGMPGAAEGEELDAEAAGDKVKQGRKPSEPGEISTEAMPPSRLSRKARKKTSALTYTLPFILILVVVILVYFLGGEKVQNLIPRKAKTVQYQDVDKLPKKLSYTQSPQEKLAQKRAPADDKPAIMTVPSEAPPAAAGTPSAGGGAAPQTPSPGLGGGGEAAPGQVPGTIQSPMPVPSARELSGDFTLPPSIAELPGGQDLTSEKLEAIINDGRRAMRRKDYPGVANGLARLKLAEMMTKPSDIYINTRFKAREVQKLFGDLDSARAALGLESGVEFEPELTGAKVRVRTNLPDSAMLGVELGLPGGTEPLSFTLPVKGSWIEIPDLGGVPSGIIVVKVIILPFDAQPEAVMGIMGAEGENIPKDYFNDEGQVVFSGEVSNAMARSRGEISWENAEKSFKQFAKGQGLESFRVSDKGMRTPGELSHISISAMSVAEEGDFIYRSCISAGYLTRNMDNPPRFLRLMLNDHLYFIATYHCRKLLQDYSGDDDAGFDYIINNLLVM